MDTKSKTPVLLSYAFRPFFLLNGLFAILVVIAWVMTLHGAGLPGLGVWWHAHEMVIGFAMASVAGFSLTAVSVWTGRPAVHGAPLGWLLFCWLAGRFAMAASHWLPASAVFALDMLFPVLLCLLLGREIISSRNRRNYPLVIIIAIMALFNVLYHLSVVGFVPAAERVAVYLLIHSILVLVTIVAGRITPAFTRNWLHSQGVKRLPIVRPALDRVTVALTVATGLAAGLLPAHPATGVLALLTALSHGFRLSGWRGLATLSSPLLFVLHVGYAWLPLAYAMLACSVFGWLFTPAAALHALTMGAITSVVLAVTTRVSLGHTGRPLQVSRAIVFTYWLMAIAVVFRIASTFTGSRYLLMIDLAAASWVLVFAIFLWVYWPVLSREK